MHQGPGNWVAIGHAVVYYARAAHAFSAGIKCRQCISERHIGKDTGRKYFGSFLHIAFHQDLVTLNKHIGYQRLTNLLEIWYINGKSKCISKRRLSRFSQFELCFKIIQFGSGKIHFFSHFRQIFRKKWSQREVPNHEYQQDKG